MDGEISTDEVHRLLEDDGEDVHVVDIRDERSFERAHIPDSENVPFDELPARIAEFDDADRVVTVCPHGKASVQAARLIGSYEGSADATVESMAGGLTEWAEAYDLVSDDEAAEEPDVPF
ncbi:rhodanese-like domain-containing protein [Salinilacihabitans rarus]|uniref:rhodanese-like domain-containing protein n=1 Tax=Salinilacihabitans rarus TaxID=2961596 RepID=UPI0020C86DD7|nr:rhodanese-like domain-containing protein [Salinilacihabitans rarus]